MTSAWGTSWGTSWGDSWGAVEAGSVTLTFNVSPLSFTADSTSITADSTAFTADRTGAYASRGEPADTASFSVQVGEAQQQQPGGGVGYTPQRRHGDVTAYGEILDVYVTLVPGDASAQTNITVAISAPLFARAELVCGDAYAEDNLEDDEVIAIILAEAA